MTPHHTPQQRPQREDDRPARDAHRAGDHGAAEKSGHHWLMIVCLLLMGAAVLSVLWRGNPFGAGTWLLLLPMLLCLGMHLLVHRYHGRHRDD
ncbi:hypothetical protein HOP52_06750 [Halomonas campisalis]|uniref:DUF2933 domain-containing protein n=1 Tax=Billgrantia campisalis TaxID=74661 RepID=A0ABS9P6R3_9GAMM|nr:hypothetical protein [Halomonas campisalis]MCG6657463.1 hypothetical protein [Halomonas campisalis]MDR5863191.1 hypothetical protein [Halomonas campisalis]